MHAIMKLDKGIVMGASTWHGVPSYVVQAGPVSVAAAREILGYPLRKEQAYRLMQVIDAIYASAKSGKPVSL